MKIRYAKSFFTEEIDLSMCNFHLIKLREDKNKYKYRKYSLEYFKTFH